MRSRLEYMFRVRRLMHELRRSQRFDLVHQLNPVSPESALRLPGSGLPLVLGTYVARWPDDPDALTAGGGWVGADVARGRDLIAAMQQRQADALLLTTPAAWNRLPDPEAVQRPYSSDSSRHRHRTFLASPGMGFPGDDAGRAAEALDPIFGECL